MEVKLKLVADQRKLCDAVAKKRPAQFEASWLYGSVRWKRNVYTFTMECYDCTRSMDIKSILRENE